MERRAFIALLAAGMLAPPRAGGAQPTRMVPTIGVLVSVRDDPRYRAFLQADEIIR